MKNLIDLMIRIPSNEEVDQANRFRTYLNYLTSISEFLGDVNSNQTYLQTIIDSRAFQNIQGGRCIDLERLSQLFRNAWFTEIQMSLTAQYDEFVPYSNHWLPVQAYYASYLAIRAYFNASGQNVNKEHSINLKVISENIQSRPTLFAHPWSVICTGNPESNSIAYHNLPSGIVISEISGLTSSARVQFWDSYAKFLKTTRHRHLEKICEDWKSANNKKRVNSIIKKKFIDNLPPTSIFHCLYRLRLRSNYADADSFLLSVQGTVEANLFHSSIRKLCWSTLSVLELLTARYIGKREFDKVVNSFRRYELRGASDDLIGFRWGVMKLLW